MLALNWAPKVKYLISISSWKPSVLAPPCDLAEVINCRGTRESVGGIGPLAGTTPNV